MSSWRVDPDCVLGVLAVVDEHGQTIETEQSNLNDIAFSGGGSLTAGGRTSMATAWTEFLERRRLVPGKLMYVMQGRISAVSEASIAVVMGDVEMSDNARDRESVAFDEWGIGPAYEYQTA